VANTRVHGTHRQPIAERWQQEKASRCKLPASEYDTSLKIFRTVYKDCLICFDTNRYQLPHVKEKRRCKSAMKTAGLPTAKSIDEYDFSFHPQLNKKEIMALFDMDFIPKKENVIFLGPPGVGKTHLAISLVQQKVVVVVHQHISKQLYLESLRHSAQGVQKQSAIIIVKENTPAVVPAEKNVIQRPPQTLCAMRVP
jgi:hypothetical protein